MGTETRPRCKGRTVGFARKDPLKQAVVSVRGGPARPAGERLGGAGQQMWSLSNRQTGDGGLSDS